MRMPARRTLSRKDPAPVCAHLGYLGVEHSGKRRLLGREQLSKRAAQRAPPSMVVGVVERDVVEQCDEPVAPLGSRVRGLGEEFG